MTEIDDLLQITNKGHNRMSGAAKLWVVVTAITVGFAVLFVLCLILAALFLK